MVFSGHYIKAVEVDLGEAMKDPKEGVIAEEHG